MLIREACGKRYSFLVSKWWLIKRKNSTEGKIEIQKKKGLVNARFNFDLVGSSEREKINYRTHVYEPTMKVFARKKKNTYVKSVKRFFPLGMLQSRYFVHFTQVPKGKKV